MDSTDLVKVDQLIERGRKMVTEKDKTAGSVLDSAYVLAIKQKEIRNAAFALLAKANFYSLVLSDAKKAIETCNQALCLINTPDAGLLAHYEAGLGVAHHLLGELELAQKNYLSAITRLESVEHKSKFDLERLPTLYYNNFILFSYSEDAYGTTEQLDRAIELYEQQDNKRGIINCYTALANHYYNRMHNLDKAIEINLKALKMAEVELQDVSMLGSCCNNAGLYYTRAGKYEQALELFDRAEAYFIKADFPFQTGTLHHQRGLAYLHMKRYEDAVISLKKAEIIYYQIDAKIEYVKVFELLADAYLGIEEYEKAFKYERRFRQAKQEDAIGERLSVLAKAKSQFETEMKEREAQLLRDKNEEISKYVKRLESSNNELKQFASVASHDLREPLRMITSYMGLVARSLNGSATEAQKEFIHFAVDGAQRMDGLIKDLLRLAKVDANPKVEMVKLQGIADEVMLNLETLVKERNAKIVCDTLPDIMADRTQMLQVFQNIIGNGIKYNESEIPVITIAVSKCEHELHISIADNGIGIPTEQRERVFQIFKRVKTEKQYSGTGLGLAICKKVIDSMGGKIFVFDNLGGGTVFELILPQGIWN